MLEPLELQHIHKGNWQSSILINRWKADSLCPFALLYFATYGPSDVRAFSLPQNFRLETQQLNKLQWEHNSNSLFSCNWYLVLLRVKKKIGCEFCSNSMKRIIMLADQGSSPARGCMLTSLNFHDRSALRRQGGHLKLMVFFTIFTADLTNKPNSDTAVSKFLPILVRRTLRYMPPCVTRARLARVQEALPDPKRSLALDCSFF